MTSSAAPNLPEMYVVPGVVVIERFFTVPLDYFEEARGTIQIFARHCVSLARQKQMDQLPFIVYLQGGTNVLCIPFLTCRSGNGGFIAAAK